MDDAAQEERWTHTAVSLAMLVNVNRGPRSAPVSPMDFLPKRFHPPPPVSPITVLRDIFVKPEPPGSPASSAP